MRDDDGSPDELAALGRGLAALRLPSRSDVSRQLDRIAEHQIPFVVVAGGWSPAIEAIGASASTRAAVDRMWSSNRTISSRTSSARNSTTRSTR